MDDELIEDLAGWYAAAARALPWRTAGTTPWDVLVSEVMLQQTPVARVEPVYLAWRERWADAAAVAAASPAELLRAWGKLGYPRRALRLRECAQAIVQRHGGQVPDSVEALRALPGIGDYTARAVAVFGYGLRAPVVDTNVRRVVARAVAGSADAAAPSTARDLRAVEAFLPADPPRAARLSIALMELGAVICTARAPRCAVCPVGPARCAWRRAGSPPATGPAPRAQRFAGTDRQVRGLLMDVLRASELPVARATLDLVWTDDEQRHRALAALVTDGLVEPLPNNHYALPSA